MSRKAQDSALEEVVAEILRLDPSGERISNVFRRTFDQLYDGQRTGRYEIDQLFKTEKTHFGTLIEINLQRELHLPDGEVLDFRIAGHEVDCKYSHTGAWMLPIESFDQLILVSRANDHLSSWSIGIVRVSVENRRTSENRDRKTGLNTHGRSQIHWIFQDRTMPPNGLLQLDSAVVQKIMEPRSGQQRVNELFRSAPNTRITRNVIATVAQQADYMKRVRTNGGARDELRPEGFVILSGDYVSQRTLATQLGAVTPDAGELVSLRLALSSAGVEIAGQRWRLATASDPVVPAPKI